MGSRMKQITIVGNRVLPEAEAKAIRIAVSSAILARTELTRFQPLSRPAENDDSSIARLTRSVEARIVDAVWTERRLPGGGSGGHCGVSYLHERAEIFANAVAAGEWKRPHPGSPPPRSIDQMHEPLSWLSWLPRDKAAIVRAAAASKHGDQQSNVAWGFVRQQVLAAEDLTIRTLQRRYDEGLRTIAVRLAFG